jgi:hypothetical protein
VVANGFQKRLRDLHPELTVDGKTLVMDTPSIAALPITELRRPVANLADQRILIQDALDTLFGSY